MIEVNNEIVLDDAIFSGLKDACWSNAKFNKFLYADLKPEYLLTCNVAESILNNFPELIIKLEDSSNNFNEDSLDKKDLMKYLETLIDFKTFSGRIDISIYNKERQAISPIGLK